MIRENYYYHTVMKFIYYLQISLYWCGRDYWYLSPSLFCTLKAKLKREMSHGFVLFFGFFWVCVCDKLRYLITPSAIEARLWRQNICERKKTTKLAKEQRSPHIYVHWKSSEWYGRRHFVHLSVSSAFSVFIRTMPDKVFQVIDLY